MVDGRLSLAARGLRALLDLDRERADGSCVARLGPGVLDPEAEQGPLFVLCICAVGGEAWCTAMAPCLFNDMLLEQDLTRQPTAFFGPWHIDGDRQFNCEGRRPAIKCIAIFSPSGEKMAKGPKMGPFWWKERKRRMEDLRCEGTVILDTNNSPSTLNTRRRWTILLLRSNIGTVYRCFWT